MGSTQAQDTGQDNDPQGLDSPGMHKCTTLIRTVTLEIALQFPNASIVSMLSNSAPMHQRSSTSELYRFPSTQNLQRPIERVLAVSLLVHELASQRDKRRSVPHR